MPVPSRNFKASRATVRNSARPGVTKRIHRGLSFDRMAEEEAVSKRPLGNGYGFSLSSNFCSLALTFRYAFSSTAVASMAAGVDTSKDNCDLPYHWNHLHSDGGHLIG